MQSRTNVWPSEIGTITQRATQARHRTIESFWFAARRASIALAGRDHAKSAEGEAGFELTVPAHRGRTARVEKDNPRRTA